MLVTCRFVAALATSRSSSGRAGCGNDFFLMFRGYHLQIVCSVTLGNVAADETLQDEIVEGGALAPLVTRQRCRSGDPTVHRLCFIT